MLQALFISQLFLLVLYFPLPCAFAAVGGLGLSASRWRRAAEIIKLPIPASRVSTARNRNGDGKGSANGWWLSLSGIVFQLACQDAQQALFLQYSPVRKLRFFHLISHRSGVSTKKQLHSLFLQSPSEQSPLSQADLKIGLLPRPGNMSFA